MSLKKIATYIIAAQVASDSGKNISSCLVSLYDTVPEIKKGFYYGYEIKDFYILEAIKLISKEKPKGFHFFVTKDYECVAKYIVYFDVSFDGERHQVSFHTFGDFSKWVKASERSRGHWRDAHNNKRDKYGYLITESRTVCAKMIIKYGLRTD